MAAQYVDIFAKEYLLMPIHDHLHWSLLLICFPGLPQDADPERTPCMLHLDSLPGVLAAANALGLLRLAVPQAPLLLSASEV